MLRNLAIRDREKGLSAGEKRIIAKARQVSTELSFATEKSEDEAEALIDGILDDSHGERRSRPPRPDRFRPVPPHSLSERVSGRSRLRPMTETAEGTVRTSFR